MDFSSVNLLPQLIEAIKINDTDQVSYCIKQGVDPNGYEDSAKIRPLHFAVLYDAFDCARILIVSGANPFLKNKNGESPLDLACELHNPPLLSLFIVH